jgi:transposase-like protein
MLRIHETGRALHVEAQPNRNTTVAKNFFCKALKRHGPPAASPSTVLSRAYERGGTK